MDLWTMIVVVVALCVGGGMYQARLKANRLNEGDEERIDELARSMDRIEVRMANVESIVLDQEKRNVLFAEKGDGDPR